MGYGAQTSYNYVIASGTSTSSEVDLGRGWERVMVDPTGIGGSTMFQVAPVVLGASGTYRLLKYNVSSGMSAPQTITVGSAVSGSIVEVPGLAGHRFVKVVADATIANGLTGKIIVSDS